MNTTQNDVQTPAGTAKTRKLSTPLRNGDEKLKAERVQEMLKSMPGWQKVSGKQAVVRYLSFLDAEAALAYGEYAMKMARSHKRRISLMYDAAAKVTVTVHGTSRAGITQNLLLFAAQLG